MKPPGLAYTEVRASADLVTVVDRPDIPASVLFESIGFRPGLEGSIGGERDFGTKHRYADYPTSQKIFRGFNLFDKNEGASYDIVVALDGSNVMSVWVNDSAYATNAENAIGQNDNWFELSKKITVTLSATPSASATSAVFPISGTGVTDSNQLRYWIAHNTTRSNVAFITASGSLDPVSITTDNILGSNGLGWQSGDSVTLYKHNGIFQGFNSSNDAYPHVRWNDVESLVRAFLYYGSAATVDATPTMRNPLAIERKSSARNFFYYGSSSFRVTVPANWYAELGGGGLIPAFKSIGTNASPQNPTGTSITGTVEIGPTYGYQITGTGTAFLTELTVGQYFSLSSGGTKSARVLKINSNTEFYADEDLGVGAATDFLIYPASSVEVDDTTNNNWLKLTLGSYFEAAVVTKKYGYRLYVTVLYDDSAVESDPVFQGFVFHDDLGNMDLSFMAEINFARMNKRISGLNFYANRIDATSSAFADAIDSETDYKLVFTLPFRSYNSEAQYQAEVQWAVNSAQTSGYIYKFLLPQFTASYLNTKLTAAPTSIRGNLQHAVDTARSYLTPRFGIKGIRPGTGVMAVDEDDNTLRICNTNGSGVIESDNFPDLLVDSAGSTLKVILQSRGELIGLENINDRIAAIKKTEVELRDLQSGLQSIIQVDTVARNGILSTPVGLFLPGRNALNLLPITGGPPVVANPLWLNRYNGNERTTDNANSRVSDTARVGIVAGYNPIYNEAWFNLVTLDADGTSKNLNYRLFLDINRWFAREVGCGASNAVASFITRKDNSFSILFGQSTTASDNGILKYPNLDTGANYTNDTVSNYEDSVSSDDASASKGITTKLLISIGNLYNLIQNAVLYELLIDSLGVMKAATSGTYNIKIYANNEFPTTFDSKTQAYDSKPSPRKVAPRGLLERVLIELSLGTSGLSNYKQFIISSLYIGAVTQKRVGNR